MSTRAFDVVLFGATGFTGGLVADYLAQASIRQPMRWAIAGRNAAKLKAVAERVSAVPGASVPMVVLAHSDDEASLSDMAVSTKVVITTVGPYALYGEPLVKACAEAGTHYVDLTGEPQFVDAIRTRWQETAARTGARIVPSCGFESIPPDIGTLYTVQQLRKQLNAQTWADASVSVRGGVEAGGSFSGGTWHSAVEAMSSSRQWMRNRPKHAKDNVHRVRASFFKDRRLNRWACAMPTIDPEVVRHTARVRGDYGGRFAYGHYILMKRLLPLAAGIVGIAGIFTLAQFGPTKNWLLQQKLPGDGPNEATRAKGWFRMSFVGEAAGASVVCQVEGGDPGYGDTAKMLAEAGLCLALDQGLPEAAGVITPASAMGEVLIPRLERAGIHFKTLTSVA